MITLGIILKNLRTVVIVSLCVLVVVLYKDNQIKSVENKRLVDNAKNLRKFDSVKYTYQLLTKDEVNEYLNYQNAGLKNKLMKAKIPVSKIKEIISTSYKFRDTVIKKFATGNFIDSSKCLTIKGFSDSSGVTIYSKSFIENLNTVSHETRKQWKWLFIKSKLFGKREITTTVFNDCGESKTFITEVKK